MNEKSIVTIENCKFCSNILRVSDVALDSAVEIPTIGIFKTVKTIISCSASHLLK